MKSKVLPLVYAIIGLLFVGNVVLANALPDTAKVTPATTLPSSTKPLASSKRPLLGLQLQFGTQGVGADLRFGLFSNLSLRAGASFIPVTANNAVNLPGFDSQNTINVNFYNVHALADFNIFKGLRLVGGAAYLYKAQGGFSVIPTGSYKYGNTTVTGADIGNLSMDVSWKGIAPYAGLGLFRAFPKHRFNFNLDLGTYYLAAPQTKIVGTGLLSDNSQLEPQFNDNLKDYRWLPVIQFNFNFKLK
jgi:hypothetical protein